MSGPKNFDPTFIARLEIAFARKNLAMALDLVEKEFFRGPKSEDQISLESSVFDAFEIRLANALFAAGFSTLDELGRSKLQDLRRNPDIGAKSVAVIQEVFSKITRRKSIDEKPPAESKPSSLIPVKGEKETCADVDLMIDPLPMDF